MVQGKELGRVIGQIVLEELKGTRPCVFRVMEAVTATYRRGGEVLRGDGETLREYKAFYDERAALACCLDLNLAIVHQVLEKEGDRDFLFDVFKESDHHKVELKSCGKLLTNASLARFSNDELYKLIEHICDLIIEYGEGDSDEDDCRDSLQERYRINRLDFVG